MEDVIKALANSLKNTFDGKSVGVGGDFDDAMSIGPFTINCYFHQWANIHHPSIHLQLIQEQFLGQPLECCGGGVHSLSVDFRISVDSKVHGYSIAALLHEALREWLCELNGSSDLTPDDYTLIVYTGIPTTNFVYEGEILSLHCLTSLSYVRQEKGAL